jgi:hypothetical protein
MPINQKNSRGGSGKGRIATSDTSEVSAVSPAVRDISDVPDHPLVSSTWSDSILVGERELIVLELYLADAIDQLLGPKRRAGKGGTQARGPP